MGLLKFALALPLFSLSVNCDLPCTDALLGIIRFGGGVVVVLVVVVCLLRFLENLPRVVALVVASVSDSSCFGAAVVPPLR